MQSVPLRFSSRVYAVFLGAISMALLILLISLGKLALTEQAFKQAYAERGVRVTAPIVGFAAALGAKQSPTRSTRETGAGGGGSRWCGLLMAALGKPSR